MDGSAVPVRSRERSSRLSTSAASRSESSMIASRSSARSSSSIVGELSASAAARIAVIGVRRSWETVRSKAVLISSLRRSASVSTVALSSSSRSIAAASSASRPGTNRSLRRREVLRVDAGRDHQRAEPVPSMRQRQRQPSAAVGRLAALQSRRGQLERAGDPLGGNRQRGVEIGPPSRVRASSAIRSASRRRASASWARLRASSASVLGDRGGDEEGGQRHPVPRVGDREPPDRRDVEEVERQRR